MGDPSMLLWDNGRSGTVQEVPIASVQEPIRHCSTTVAAETSLASSDSASILKSFVWKHHAHDRLLQHSQDYASVADYALSHRSLFDLANIGDDFDFVSGVESRAAPMWTHTVNDYRDGSDPSLEPPMESPSFPDTFGSSSSSSTDQTASLGSLLMSPSAGPSTMAPFSTGSSTTTEDHYGWGGSHMVRYNIINEGRISEPSGLWTRIEQSELPLFSPCDRPLSTITSTQTRRSPSTLPAVLPVYGVSTSSVQELIQEGYGKSKLKPPRISYGPNGILLSTALRGSGSGGADRVAFEGVEMSQKMSMRYKFKGLRSYSRQVNVLSRARNKVKQPTYDRLANLAAKEMWKFTCKNKNFKYEWNKLVLLHIDLVAKGSLQPRIGVLP